MIQIRDVSTEQQVAWPSSSRYAYLTDVLLDPSDTVRPQHEPQLQRSESPTQGYLPVLQPLER